MQRISISEDDLGDSRSPAVYAPVGGALHPEVYGPKQSTAAERRVAVPIWLTVIGVALVILIASGAYLVGRTTGTSDTDVQRRLTDQRVRLQREADQATRQSAEVARARARATYAARLTGATRAARAEGRSRGYDAGYEAGLLAGQNQTCTGLIC